MEELKKELIEQLEALIAQVQKLQQAQENYINGSGSHQQFETERKSFITASRRTQDTLDRFADTLANEAFIARHKEINKDLGYDT